MKNGIAVVLLALVLLVGVGGGYYAGFSEGRTATFQLGPSSSTSTSTSVTCTDSGPTDGVELRVVANNGSRAGVTVNGSLSVVGSWNGGKSGPMPSGVQVSLQQPTFQLRPGQVVCFWVDEANSLSSSDVSGTNNYTLAVQEIIGSSTYLEPLSLSITSGTLIGPLGSGVTPVSNGPRLFGLSSGEVLAIIAVVAISAILASVLLLKKTRAPQLGQ